MTSHASALLLFESSDTVAVQQDPANEDWVALVRMIDGERFERIGRRYYEALYHFRKEARRPAMPGQLEIVAPDRQGAMQEVLAGLQQRTASGKAENAEQQALAVEVFVDPVPNVKDESLPASLRDFTHPPLPLRVTLGGRGRPPCDALCLLRAFRQSEGNSEPILAPIHPRCRCCSSVAYYQYAPSSRRGSGAPRRQAWVRYFLPTA